MARPPVTHYMPEGLGISRCGQKPPTRATEDWRLVDCRRCHSPVPSPRYLLAKSDRIRKAATR